MALNRERPHLLVLPEDDATRNIAVGFSDFAKGQLQVLNPARGWGHVKEEMIRTYSQTLRRYAGCHLVLLIDFDDDFPNRIDAFRQDIPSDIAPRIYVIGALTEAETLKRAINNKKFSKIGLELAEECENGQLKLWNHPQLAHNSSELSRLHTAVHNFLF